MWQAELISNTAHRTDCASTGPFVHHSWKIYFLNYRVPSDGFLQTRKMENVLYKMLKKLCEVAFFLSFWLFLIAEILRQCPTSRFWNCCCSLQSHGTVQLLKKYLSFWSFQRVKGGALLVPQHRQVLVIVDWWKAICCKALIKDSKRKLLISISIESTTLTRTLGT